jgi:flagellar biosynthesis/type III secretory pathway protein FliH
VAVIKSTHSAPLLKEAVALDLGDLSRQADQVRAQAGQAARAILLQAQEQARALTGHARQEGLLQGLAQGQTQGLEEGRRQGRTEALAQSAAEFEKVQKAWLDAAAQWDQQRQDLERDARQAVLELALRLGEKITHRMAQVDPTVAADQLAHVLRQVLTAQDLTVRIHPSDRPTLEQAMPRLSAQFPRFRHLHLVDDATVSRGGCVVAYGQGSISADLDTQLGRLAELLLPDRRAVAAPPGALLVGADAAGTLVGKPPVAPAPPFSRESETRA